jgi:hypothetical protein
MVASQLSTKLLLFMLNEWFISFSELTDRLPKIDRP